MLTYELFGTLLFLVILFFAVTDWIKRRRFKRYVSLGTDMRLHEAQRKEHHVMTGSIGMTLLQADDKIKGLLISALAFRDGSFSIPSVDRLYLKGDSAQYVSVGFRIRRHDLRPLRGKQVGIRVKGKLYFKDGRIQDIKASLVVGIPALQEDRVNG